MDRAEELVKEAERNERLSERVRVNYGFDVPLRDFGLLLESGGKMIMKNEHHCDNCYLHKLKFGGYTFKTLTRSPLRDDI